MLCDVCVVDVHCKGCCLWWCLCCLCVVFCVLCAICDARLLCCVCAAGCALRSVLFRCSPCRVLRGEGGVPRCLCAMCKLYALCYVCVLLCVGCVMPRRSWSVCACCSLCCVLGAFLQSACNVLCKRRFASLRMLHAVCRGMHPSLTPQSCSSPHSRWTTHKHRDHGAAPTHTAHSMQTS